jgi:hypothetical protein
MPTLKLYYKTVFIPITFSLPTSLPTPGGFLFKNIIGKEFRKKFCTARYDLCSACSSNLDCVYGSTLEPIITKENAAMKGRDKVMHPIIIESSPFVPRETVELVLRITFVGKAIKHISHFYEALKVRSNVPLLKTKVTYAVKGFTDGKNALLENACVNTEIDADVWEYVPDTSAAPDTEPDVQKMLVETQTPLRFRGSGRYTDEFTAKNFMNCLHKRTQNLVTQHGINDFEKDYGIASQTMITKRNYSWHDLDHYSTRQRKVVKLGGNTGSFHIEGGFTAYEKAMFRFAEIFHAGEHSSFGLGRLAVHEINET